MKSFPLCNNDIVIHENSAKVTCFFCRFFKCFSSFIIMSTSYLTNFSIIFGIMKRKMRSQYKRVFMSYNKLYRK